jgi:hypothetical protein
VTTQGERGDRDDYRKIRASPEAIHYLTARAVLSSAEPVGSTATYSTKGWMGGTEMQNPEVYRKKGNQCLLEAAQAHESSRVTLIMQAQRWFELAELFGLSPSEQAKQSDERAPKY